MNRASSDLARVLVPHNGDRAGVVGRRSDAGVRCPEEPGGEYGLQVLIGMPTYCPYIFYFSDEHHGWLTNTNGYVARTNDGGRTWVDISRVKVEAETIDPAYFSSIHLASDGHGLALDNVGELQETVDGGVVWAPETDLHTFIAMHVLNDENIWLVGYNGIYKTSLKGR